MNNLHIRFTPLPGQLYDLSGYLAKMSSKYIVSQEQATSYHLHICLETERCEETARSTFMSMFNVPKVGRGQGNKNYCFKWNKYKNWNPEYAAKSGDIIMSMGFTEDEIEDAIWRGSIKFNKQADSNSKGTSIDLQPQIREVTEPKQTQSEWERLLEAYEKTGETGVSMLNIKRWIKSFYLLRRKCIQRDGDLKRYAYSLYAIVNKKVSRDDQSVLEETQEIYI